MAVQTANPVIDPNDPLIAKAIGSIAGSALALLIVPSRTFRGFLKRLAASLIGGFIFGSSLQAWTTFFQPNRDGTIAACCTSAFACWFCAGTAIRLIRSYKAD